MPSFFLMFAAEGRAVDFPIRIRCKRPRRSVPFRLVDEVAICALLVAGDDPERVLLVR